VVDLILHTFAYSLLEFYAANLAVDGLKENIVPNSDCEQKMAPTISPAAVELKPAPLGQIPSSVVPCAPMMAHGYQPASVVPQPPIPYASMPAPPTFQTQYFSAPPAAPHPSY
jgi:hypothetical protein